MTSKRVLSAALRDAANGTLHATAQMSEIHDEAGGLNEYHGSALATRAAAHDHTSDRVGSTANRLVEKGTEITATHKHFVTGLACSAILGVVATASLAGTVVFSTDFENGIRLRDGRVHWFAPPLQHGADRERDGHPDRPAATLDARHRLSSRDHRLLGRA
jgi:hypothetical protein